MPVPNHDHVDSAHTAQVPIVRLDIFAVPTLHIAGALMRMGLHRITLRRSRNIRFWKLLGTGSGKTFTVRDADPHQWAILTVWNSRSEAEEFSRSSVMNSWLRISDTHATFHMVALSAHGKWAGQTPFGEPVATPVGSSLIAVITRARIKVRWWPEFWRSVPAVSADLHKSAGLLASVGIGEAPLGLQGTFSLWRDNRSVTEFATGRPEHNRVIQRTHETQWYAEELFARFIVVEMTGNLSGTDLDSLLAQR
ncbi:unannotated protein [freshwater metagenome]|uniref:Unannotated protein n=1 Tax=freshwater metagenome TaxID=449393 RepID=A0A6J5ZA43_9ZZZZ